ncbi:hypothetical protein Poli38472_004140 [Pythium oligandrum]|uniref:DRBM domain-containing protein n=1 Tax=Pythium oligandrum TaxID=41045 RepID=A0A8K1FJS6_PYTOL|nr:hypothetical protein Poli38472_004140 [Pythium oligandrum]|eukprot:TMW66375.1 hypothetical protein Poli38472_004140 [Pythium oligandrum]
MTPPSRSSLAGSASERIAGGFLHEPDEKSSTSHRTEESDTTTRRHSVTMRLEFPDDDDDDEDDECTSEGGDRERSVHEEKHRSHDVSEATSISEKSDYSSDPEHKADRPLEAVSESEEVIQLRCELQAMREQVYLLQKMTQDVTPTEKQLVRGKHVERIEKRLSFSGISPVKKTPGSYDVIEMPDDGSPFTDKWSVSTQSELDHTFHEATASEDPELLQRVQKLGEENAELKRKLEARSELSDNNQIDELNEKLSTLESENARLRANLVLYEEENVRLHAAIAAMDKPDLSSSRSVDPENTLEEENQGTAAEDELGIAGTGPPTEVNHTRCEEKIHELWQTIKTLKTYVETFRIEIEDLTVQRNEALASANQAWEQNAQLAGNNNPQQRIKYLHQLKKENSELVEKVRVLQSRLTRRQLKGLNEDATSSRRSSIASSVTEVEQPGEVDYDGEPSDNESDIGRSELFKRMWAHNKKLEGEIDTHTSKKRKANEALGKPEPVFEVRGRVGNDLPLVEIDGSVLESPEGKTVHAFLREVASVAWRAVPQYYFTKTDDLQNPVACWVRINHRKYANMARSTKPLAKEAAAEAVLEEHLPGYWTDLMKEGRVGKQAQLQQQHQPQQQQDQQQQPQSQQKAAEKKTPVEHEPSMSLDDFKKLTIDDPRVLQACMELSIKTPAQVLQEYQNRNRGISINYNTVPTEKDGAKLFKTIVTAGSTAAEGTASTKKVAKQLAAQSLLALLHHPRFKCYHDVVDLYSSFNKGNHATAGALPQPLVKTEPPNGSYGRQSPSKKARRTLPTNVSGSSAGGSHHARNGMPRNGWDGYHGYGVPPNPGPGAGWQQQQQPSENGMAYAAKRERIVEYSTTPSAYGGYYGGGDGWGYGQGQQYYQYNPSAYHPPAAAGPFPPSMEGGLAQSYGSRDPRARPFNRSEVKDAASANLLARCVISLSVYNLSLTFS